MKTLKQFSRNGLIILKFDGGGMGLFWDLNSNLSNNFMYDVKMTRHLST